VRVRASAAVRIEEVTASTGSRRAWQNRRPVRDQELRWKTDVEFEAELEDGLEFLRDRGYASVAMVARSFGDRLAPASLRANRSTGAVGAGGRRERGAPLDYR